MLPMFSRELIDYTMSTFKESKIDVLTGTMVKEVKEKSVVLQMPDKTIKEVPVGMVVWAGGNKARGVSIDLMSRLPDAQKNKRGITVDGNVFSLFRALLSDLVDFAQRSPSCGGHRRQHLCRGRLHFDAVRSHSTSRLAARDLPCTHV